MKILILGGTLFLGRHLSKCALAAGHEVTLFNRGQTDNALFPEVTRLIGDRSSDLKALCTGEWDIVYDLSGYHPNQVRATAELVESRVSRYVFVSTISVYKDFTIYGIKEGAETIAGYEGYGALKARCEEEVIAVFGDRGVIVRPGLIVGSWDPTFRFNYWLDRVARGGAILAPGRPERFIQVIDAVDLAQFLLLLADVLNGAPIYNATGAANCLSMAGLLDAIEEVAVLKGARHVDRRFLWVSDVELLERSVAEWTELPLWIAESGDWRGHNHVDSGLAQATGLSYRPIGETIGSIFDTQPALAAGNGRPLDGDGRDPRLLPTLSPSLEEAILADLHLL